MHKDYLKRHVKDVGMLIQNVVCLPLRLYFRLTFQKCGLKGVQVVRNLGPKGFKNHVPDRQDAGLAFDVFQRVQIMF